MNAEPKPGVFYHPGGVWGYDGEYANRCFTHSAGWYYIAPTTHSGELIVFGDWRTPGVNGFKSEAAAQAVFDRHMRRAHWAKIWRKAVRNMPYRLSKSRYVTWVPRKPGSTLIPDFIKDQVKQEKRQKLKQIDGVVHEKQVKFEERRYGQRHLLARIITQTCNIKWTSMTHEMVRHGVVRGTRPKDDKRRELLLTLAGPEGNAMAWTWLKANNRDHLYVK